MEEMQKAFNKTIIKLQNTSRMAEEQVRDVSSLNPFKAHLVGSVQVPPVESVFRHDDVKIGISILFSVSVFLCLCCDFRIRDRRTPSRLCRLSWRT